MGVQGLRFWSPPTLNPKLKAQWRKSSSLARLLQPGTPTTAPGTGWRSPFWGPPHFKDLGGSRPVLRGTWPKFALAPTPLGPPRWPGPLAFPGPWPLLAAWPPALPCPSPALPSLLPSPLPSRQPCPPCPALSALPALLPNCPLCSRTLRTIWKEKESHRTSLELNPKRNRFGWFGRLRRRGVGEWKGRALDIQAPTTNRQITIHSKMHYR